MWLRDFLPAQLEESRVMTFGYSSRLGDSGNMSSLEEWAHGLLSAVSSVRESISVSKAEYRLLKEIANVQLKGAVSSHYFRLSFTWGISCSRGRAIRTIASPSQRYAYT